VCISILLVVKMGRMPGTKRRERETDHEIKAGKQQKLNIGTLFRQNQGSSVSSPSSPSTASEVSPENSATIKYVPVHEILDEASPEALYGNLSEDNLKIAMNEHQRLLKLSQLQFQNRTKTSSMVKRRNVYSESQKTSIIKLFQTLQGLNSERLLAINKISGYEKIKKKNIDEWIKSQKKRSGRKISNEFERDVAGELILYRVMELPDGNMADQAEILANSIYSYECVRTAAKNVYARNKSRWDSDPLVNRLKFTDKWVHGFLRRLQFTKRRVTSVLKIIPPPEVVRARMNEIKDFIISEGISPDRIFNADETGVKWAPELQHQFVPDSAVRAVAPPGNESGRFTALLGSDALGRMLPFYFIVKCSCKDPHDLRGSTILKKFFGEDKFFKPSEGWIEGTWSTVIVIKEVPRTIHRPYLLNTNTLDLMTVQGKAWNDTPGCLMWVELQLKAFKVSLLSSIDLTFTRRNSFQMIKFF
jgi:hypothetical protein